MSTETEHHVACPVHKIKPMAALLQHAEKAALPSQTKVIHDFHTAEVLRANGKVKKHRNCKICLKECILINEISTLCCHAEAKFSVKYWKWAREHSFELMLPGNVKACKDNAVQQSINNLATKKGNQDLLSPPIAKAEASSTSSELTGHSQGQTGINHENERIFLPLEVLGYVDLIRKTAYYLMFP
ncbi:hypothetical protein BD769DRAFT_1388335 [Suillus cothurnatus]|nr:hypothetical protein BD769DRAFT_1388335 [Suillus cothurnatus]